MQVRRRARRRALARWMYRLQLHSARAFLWRRGTTWPLWAQANYVGMPSCQLQGFRTVCERIPKDSWLSQKRQYCYTSVTSPTTAPIPSVDLPYEKSAQSFSGGVSCSICKYVIVIIVVVVVDRFYTALLHSRTDSLRLACFYYLPLGYFSAALIK